MHGLQGLKLSQTKTAVASAVTLTLLGGLLSILTACAKPGSIPRNSSTQSMTSSDSHGGSDGGGGDTDRASFQDIRAAVEKLVQNKFINQARASEIQTYKNKTGQIYNDAAVSVSSDPELLKMLDDLNEDITHRGDRADPKHREWKFDFRENGSCHGSDGEREGAATIGDQSATICLSLPRIQAMTRKADLDNAMAALVMHELSHEHGADEMLAKKVERYYSLPAVQNINAMLTLRRAVALTRVHLRQLTEAAVQKSEARSQICSVSGATLESSTLLQDQVAATGITASDQSETLHSAVAGLQTAFVNIQLALACHSNQRTPVTVDSDIESAKLFYDQLTQELRKNTGLLIINFSDVLCAADNASLCNGL